MEDRIPTPGQEGRVLITPEDGSTPYYAKISMADNPTNPGTALNKENLLKDSTEVELFGNSNNRTVDQAFSGIAGRINLIMQDVASMTLTVQDSAGAGIPGVLIGGMLDADGEAVYTNATGVATGYVSEGAVVLSISGYADIADYSEQIQAVKGETYTKTVTVTTRDFLKITSSGNIKFSENVEQVDVACGGAGGGAGDFINGWNLSRTGGAGGGGYVASQTDVTFSPNTPYPVAIGAGGPGAAMYSQNDGGDGGSTTCLGVTAAGGKGGKASTSQAAGQGGAGNGNGANGTVGTTSGATGQNGGNGTQQIFSSFTATTPYGGGGASGGACTRGYNADGGTGGSPGGGDGGTATAGDGVSRPQDGHNGDPGTGGGGGSGASSVDEDGGVYRIGSGGSGGSGCVCLRMHLKSAA